jgi:COP9 signalosome complex subunit 4
MDLSSSHRTFLNTLHRLLSTHELSRELSGFGWKFRIMSMSTADVREAVTQIERSSPPSRPESYQLLQSQILTDSRPSGFVSNVELYITSVLSDSLGILQARPLLASFVSDFAQVEDAELKVEAGKAVLKHLSPRQSSFEDEVFALKNIVADTLESEEDFKGAALVLQSINVEQSNRSLTADDKAKHWIRIMRCYLEEDEPQNAVSQMTRVKQIFHDVKDRDTRIAFLLCQARILDSQRTFLEASAKYYELSQQSAVAEEERLRGLSSAIVCAVLAPAGPQRSVEMAKLYKDDRAKQVEEFPIMEKIFLNRILSPEEVKAFAEKLAPHQRAKTADGSTVLDKAVLEHNLLAVSRLYRNMYTKQLGQLLGVSADRAESYAAQMIEQGRLKGSIDQMEGLVSFELDSRGASVGHQQKQRDAHVQSLSQKVESLSTTIQEQYPVSGLLFNASG